MSKITKLCYKSIEAIDAEELSELTWVRSYEDQNDIKFRSYLTMIPNTESNQDRYCKWFTISYEFDDNLFIIIDNVVDPGDLNIISINEFNETFSKSLSSYIIKKYNTLDGFDIIKLSELESVEDRKSYLNKFIKLTEYCKPIKLIDLGEFKLQVIYVDPEFINYNLYSIGIREFSFDELAVVDMSDCHGIKVSKDNSAVDEFNEAVKLTTTTINKVLYE